MSLKMNIGGRTDVGKRRKNNEDVFLTDPDLGLMIVADGMGGHASGEVASKMAATLCAEQLKKALNSGHVPIFFHVPPNPKMDPRSLLLGDCVKFANFAVYEAAHNNPENKDMGTTMVSALWMDDKLAVAHVGDSRLYTVQKGKLLQRTTDHSFVQDQLNRGLITPEDAEKSDMKNLLLRSIGNQEDVEVEMHEIPMDKGDYVFLCSDGLNKMMADDKILQAFKGDDEPQKIADQLIQSAIDAGGTDNVTVVVGRVEDGPGSWGSLADRVKTLLGQKKRR